MRGRLGARLSALAAVAIVVAPAATAGFPWPGVWGAWASEAVDVRDAHGASLALDSSGNPRIAYTVIHRVGVGELIQAVRSGPIWRLEGIPTGTNAPVEPSIAIDSSGRTHIAYLDETNSDLRYVRWTGSAWVDELVYGVGSVGLYPRLTITPNGDIHVLHQSGHTQNTEVFYSKKVGGEWSTQRILTPGQTMWGDLASDDSGTLHAVIQGKGSPFRVIYARLLPGGSWDFDEFPASGHGSIAVTPTGNVHVSYVPSISENSDISSMELWHATLVEGVWSRTPTGNIVETSGLTSIDLDSSARPHVTYHQRIGFDATRTLTGKTWYATPIATGSWSHEVLDLVGFDTVSSIQLGPDDVPRVAYQYVSDRDLKDVLGQYDVRYAEPVPAKVTAITRS